MIWKSIVRPRAAATTYARWSAFARNTVGTVSDFAGVVRNLALDIRDSYRPELHYMRGPGPKWRAKHANFHMALAEPKPDWLRKTASNQRDQRRGWRMRLQQSLYSEGNRSGAFASGVRHHRGDTPAMSVSPRAEHLASLDRASSAENAAHPEQSRTQEF